MKEQISQCNSYSKDVYKTVKMIDGEVKQSNGIQILEHPRNQINLIETLKEQNIAEQIYDLMDSRIIEFMDQNDRQFFYKKLIELNELQYNPSGNSENQNNFETMLRIQEIQQIVSKYYNELEAIKPRQVSLEVSTMNVNLDEILDINKQQIKTLFQFSVNRPLCHEEIIFKMRLNSTLKSTLEYSKTSEFFKNEGTQVMKNKECNHVYAVTIKKSDFNDDGIVISIPDFDIHQQYIMDKNNWEIIIELIKDSDTFKNVSENSKKLSLLNMILDNLISKSNNFKVKLKLKILKKNYNNDKDKKKNNNNRKRKMQKINKRKIMIKKQNNKMIQSIKIEKEYYINKIMVMNNFQGKKQFFKYVEKIQNIVEKQQFSQIDLVEMKQQLENEEKCQIFGHMFVKKVPGNFHISFHNEGLLTLYFQQIFNLRHTIHTLEFTTEDGILSLGKYTKSSNPLDNTQHNPGDGNDYDYYLKIVNTIFENMLSKHENIYSFTYLQLMGTRDFRLPAVNFKYEFDPITVLHYRQTRSLSKFIISLCAIIGGSIALSKYIHFLLVK